MLIHMASVAVGCVILTGCSDSPSEQAQQSNDGASRQDERQLIVHRYTTRGVVTQVPAEGKPMRAFRVKHEPIDDFKKDGKTVGMDAMIMDFPPAEGVSLAGIEPGDKVRLHFETRTEAETGLQVGWKATRVQKLPDDTALEFGEAEPATQPSE